jgi:tetratricopeptide (TPR) repeat protein
MRLLLAFALACAAWGSPAAPAAPSQNAGGMQTFLVLPFENGNGAPTLDWLSEGLAEMTAQRLAGPSRLVLPRSEWQAAAERVGLPATGRLSRASMLRLAKESDADFVVFGRFTAEGGHLRIFVQALRPAGPALSSEWSEAGAREDLSQIHAALCWRLLSHLDSMFPQSRAGYVAAAPRHSFPALENYFRGALAAGPERLRLLREAARLEPEWPDPAFALGQAYFEEGNHESALIWLSRVPPAHARGAEAGFLAGVCHLLRNDAPRAEAALDAILSPARLLPAQGSPPAIEYPEALNNLAIAESRQGKWREAARHWDAAIRLSPPEPAYPFNLALGALRAGEIPAAIRALRTAARLRPDDPGVRGLLAAALAHAGQKAEAAIERTLCGAACPPAAEFGALFSSDAGIRAHAAARLDRISTTLDVLGAVLARQSREEGPSNRSGDAGSRSPSTRRP